MKKWLIFFGAVASIAALPCFAQDNFYQDLLISDEVKAQIEQEKSQAEFDKNMNSAKNAARSLLNKKAQKIQIDAPQAERRKATPTTKAVAEETLNLDSAPFGLLWKASVAGIKNMGVILKPIEDKDYTHVFEASHLPKDPKGFREVDITFGQEDELWRILAIGDFINDDASASKVLKEYRKYSRLLSQKYGSPKEFFTPKITDVEKKIMVNGVEKTTTEQKPEPIGNPEFLNQLQSGEAVLYSTFVGNNIGAALAINVDGDGKSYIIIDYKNIKILQDRENASLDIL